jgi:hypothetical protein
MKVNDITKTLMNPNSKINSRPINQQIPIESAFHLIEIADYVFLHNEVIDVEIEI